MDNGTGNMNIQTIEPTEEEYKIIHKQTDAMRKLAHDLNINYDQPTLTEQQKPASATMASAKREQQQGTKPGKVDLQDFKKSLSLTTQHRPNHAR